MQLASDWLRCKGVVPKIIFFFCRRGHQWAKNYAFPRMKKQIEDEQMEAIVGTVFSTGKIVYGTVDDDGRLTMRIQGEDDESRGDEP